MYSINFGIVGFMPPHVYPLKYRNTSARGWFSCWGCFLLGQDLVAALAAAAQPFTPTGAGSSAGVATGFSAGFSSAANFSHSPPPLSQARTAPIFFFFSPIHATPHS